MKNFFLVLAALLFLISCKEEAVKNEANPEDEALAVHMEPVAGRTVSLTPEAMEVASQWLAFATAQNEIQDLRGATGYQIITSSDPLTQIMESLNSTLPDTLQVTPIETRTTVLVTKAEVLHQRAIKKQRRASEIYQAAADLINEFENFKLQLNERFLPSPSNFENELDRQFQAGQDSIRALAD